MEWERNMISQPTQEQTEIARMTTKGRRGWAALGLFMAELPEELAWHERATLQSVLIKRKPQSWLVVIRVTRKGQSLVSFLEGDDFLTAVRLIWIAVYKHRFIWRDDRFKKGS